MYDLSKVVVTSSPHIKSDEDTRSVMFDVIIALLPALAVAFYTFGARALVITCAAAQSDASRLSATAPLLLPACCSPTMSL